MQPAWLLRMVACSCLGLVQQGTETMADRSLVLVPHQQGPNVSWCAGARAAAAGTRAYYLLVLRSNL